MSITVATEPDAQHAAYTFVEYDVTTTRDDAYQQTVTNVAESTFIGAGKVKFIVSGTSNFEISDIVIGSGFSDTRLNRKHRVRLVSGNNVEVDTDWNTDFAGDAGQIDKQNDNLNIRGDLYTIEDNTGESFTTATLVGLTNYTRLNGIGDTSKFIVGQPVRISGSTNYDGLHRVNTVNASDIIIGTTFIADDSGDMDTTAFVAARRVNVANSSGEYTFNFASMLQSVLDFNIASLLSTGITNTAPLSVRDYCITFVEEYDDENGLVFEPTGVLGATVETISSDREAHNITRQVDEVVSISEYLMQNITKSFLTNQPDGVAIGSTEHAQLHFVVNESIGDVQYRVKKFDSLDVQIGATFISGGFTLVNNRGIINIESSMWDANTASIEVTLNADPGGAVLGGAKTFTIDHKCYVNPVRFHWLNRLGGFDSYTFTADHENTIVTDRSLFERTRTSSSTVEDRGAGIYNVSARKEFEIFTRFENEATRLWLEELFTSPVVYYEDGTDLIPIVVQNGDQTIDVNGLVQMQINYTHSNALVLQHG